MKFVRIAAQQMLLAALVVGCAPVLTQTPGPSDLRHVLVNGRPFSADSKSLVEVLMIAVSPDRIGAHVATREEMPLVVIDGLISADGVRALAGVPAFHAASVDVLRSAQAVQRFGSLARNGAIVVRTRTSR